MKRQTSQTTSDYEWLRVTTSDCEWLRVRLQVTTSDCKWLRQTTSQTTSDYAWLQVTMSDYESSQTTSDYEWLRVRLQVTTNDYKWQQVASKCNWPIAYRWPVNASKIPSEWVADWSEAYLKHSWSVMELFTELLNDF